MYEKFYDAFVPVDEVCLCVVLMSFEVEGVDLAVFKEGGQAWNRFLETIFITYKSITRKVFLDNILAL